MRFFIKRENKNIEKAAFGSALLMVSAFAVSIANPLAGIAATHSKEVKESPSDTLTARNVFERLNSTALEILPHTTRLDMLDYWDVDSVYKASNAMEGLSWLETVSRNYLKVRITAVSTLEIKILPAKKSDIIMTVHTIGDDVQAQDSGIKFYDENLNEIPADKHLKMPEVKDFFDIPKGSATSMKEIEDMIPFPTIAFSANPENDNLEARLTVEKYINEDDWNIAKLFFKPAITALWHKEKFKFR